jgi:TonB-like protein
MFLRHFIAWLAVAVLFACPVLGQSKTAKHTAMKTIDLGVVNGRAVHLPLLDYPRAARKAHAGGLVEIRVLINMKGEVTRASVVSGHRLLRQVCLESGRKSLFPAQMAACEDCTHFIGTLQYKFNLAASDAANKQ